MTHEARIVGSEDVLGEVHRGVEFYGHTLTREWSPVDFDAAALAKADTNPHVEVRKPAPKPAAAPAPVAAKAA